MTDSQKPAEQQEENEVSRRQIIAGIEAELTSLREEITELKRDIANDHVVFKTEYARELANLREENEVLKKARDDWSDAASFHARLMGTRVGLLEVELRAQAARAEGLVEAATDFMNLECDYQAEDTRSIHFSVQYWIEEKARRKSKLREALSLLDAETGGKGGERG